MRETEVRRAGVTNKVVYYAPRDWVTFAWSSNLKLLRE